ncbi:hypothetical protein ACFLRW_06155 [Acidobacteriota bacterium]
MGLKLINFNSPWGRRQFIKSGVSIFLSILILPVRNVFSRNDQTVDSFNREQERLVEIAQKYGAEFGGEDAFQMSEIKKGGQNVCI